MRRVPCFGGIILLRICSDFMQARHGGACGTLFVVMALGHEELSQAIGAVAPNHKEWLSPSLTALLHLQKQYAWEWKATHSFPSQTAKKLL